MPSKSRTAFTDNAKDVERLLEIHSDVGGDAKGRRFGLEVLNKSAIILVTAVWEAYCEDVASEALEHLVTHVPSGAALPVELKKKIAAETKADKNDLAMWDLADGGWKQKVKARLVALTADRNRKLNTPKTEQINELFASSIGLSRVSDSWRWKKMPVSTATAKLDRYVALRGSIAHRGAADAAVKKSQVLDYFEHVKKLVAKTGGSVNSHVRAATGKPLW